MSLTCTKPSSGSPHNSQSTHSHGGLRGLPRSGPLLLPNLTPIAPTLTSLGSFPLFLNTTSTVESQVFCTGFLFMERLVFRLLCGSHLPFLRVLPYKGSLISITPLPSFFVLFIPCYLFFVALISLDRVWFLFILPLKYMLCEGRDFMFCCCLFCFHCLEYCPDHTGTQ